MSSEHKQTAFACGVLFSALIHGLALALFNNPSPQFRATLGTSVISVIQASLSPATTVSAPAPTQSSDPEHDVKPQDTRPPISTRRERLISPPALTKKIHRNREPLSQLIAHQSKETPEVIDSASHKKAAILNTVSEVAPTKLESSDSLESNRPKPQSLQPLNETDALAHSTPAQPQPGEQLHSSIQQHLAEALRERFRYPMIARQRGWQGVVRLRFVVRPDGEIADIQLAESSGFRLLDKDAVRTASRLKRLPKHLGWKSDDSLMLELPVRYQLHG